MTGDPDGGPIRTTVGILVTDSRRRGAEVQAERTAAGLRDLGWDVEFRSLSTSPGPAVEADPLTTKRRSDLGRFNPSLVAPTRKFLRRHAEGVVLAWGSLSVRYVAAAAVTLRRRPRLGYRSIGSPLYWLSGRREFALYRLVAKRYDFVIAVSKRIEQELVEAIGIPSSKVNVITAGIPSHLLKLQRVQHGGPTRVLFIGSLSEEKDPLAAVTAFGIAADEVELGLTVVGDGPLLQAVQDVVSRLGLEESVELAGSVADITPYVARADIVLLTSKTEGLPGVLIEAAAAGLPAVAYDVGSVEEVVQDEESGIVVRDRSIESAARALATLAHDEDLRRRLGDRARAIASERFLIESTVARTDQLLRDQLVSPTGR